MSPFRWHFFMYYLLSSLLVKVDSYLYGDYENTYCWLTPTNTTTIGQPFKCNASHLHFYWSGELRSSITAKEVWEANVNFTNWDLTIRSANISHWNLHICSIFSGTCTPLLNIAPLVTLTPAVWKTMPPAPSTLLLTGKQTFEVGKWIVIAHINFFTATEKYDVAIGKEISCQPSVEPTRLLEAAVLTLGSIGVFLVAVVLWQRCRKEQKELLRHEQQIRAYRRELLIIGLDVLIILVGRSIQAIAFAEFFSLTGDQRQSMTIPYSFFNVLAFCGTLIMLYVKVNSFWGTWVELSAIKEKKKKHRLDVIEENPEEELKKLNEKIEGCDRYLARLQLSICLAFLDDIPLTILNMYLLYNLDQMRQFWAFCVALVFSLILVGYHVSLIEMLFQTLSRKKKYVKRRCALKGKEPPMEAQKNLPPEALPEGTTTLVHCHSKPPGLTGEHSPGPGAIELPSWGQRPVTGAGGAGGDASTKRPVSAPITATSFATTGRDGKLPSPERPRSDPRGTRGGGAVSPARVDQMPDQSPDLNLTHSIAAAFARTPHAPPRTKFIENLGESSSDDDD